MKVRDKLKRAAALVLALALVLSLGAGAMAVDERSAGVGGRKNDRHEVIHDRDDREDVYHNSDDAYHVTGDVYEVTDDVRIYEENVAAIRGVGIVFGDEGDPGDVISWVETAQLAVCLERVVSGRDPYKIEMHGNRYCTRSLRDKLLSEPPSDPYAGVARTDAAMIFAAVGVPGGVEDGVLSTDGELLRREAAAIAANILRLAARSSAGVVQNE